MGFRESQWLPLVESGEWKENISFSADFKIPFGWHHEMLDSLLDKTPVNSCNVCDDKTMEDGLIDIE